VLRGQEYLLVLAGETNWARPSFWLPSLSSSFLYPRLFFFAFALRREELYLYAEVSEVSEVVEWSLG
jgi:hypothetical protein